MNLRDFEYIIAVDDHRHFGKAAEHCFVSQPTLSGQIRKLEEELGVPIFERTKRFVRPTPVGVMILEKARRALSEADSVRALAAAMIDPLGGPLALGAIPTIAPFLSPRLVPAISHHLPHVALTLREAQTKDVEAMLVEGVLDVAIIATAPQAAQLTTIELYDEPFWIALPNGHPLSAVDALEMDALVEENLLLLSEGHCLRDQVLSFFPKRKTRGTKIRTEETSLTTILSLVGGGHGITLVPAMSLAGPWTTGAAFAVRAEASGRASRRVRLAFRKSALRTALISELASVIVECLPETVTPLRAQFALA